MGEKIAKKAAKKETEAGEESLEKKTVAKTPDKKDAPEKIPKAHAEKKAAPKPAAHAEGKSAKDVEASQPEVNIGLVGHVDHGKTTLTEALTGKWTDTHSEEIKKGITIRLGYADAIFRKCPNCKEYPYTVKAECGRCNSPTMLVRKVSFVDAPGHESLMATMLSGATIMDGALLLIAANEECPQPQTREHLMALEIIGISKVVVVQNKIDLVSEEDAMKNYNQIREFLNGTPYKDAPIIPVSAGQRINIDVLVQAIEETIPTPERDRNAIPIMFVARSFDINKPGADPMAVSGGVLGGSIKQGALKKGMSIEIRPGRRVEREGRVIYEPITTSIADIKTGGKSVEEAMPGGSIGVLTLLDPAIVKADALSGSIVGEIGKLPAIRNALKLEIHLLERVVGAKDKLLVDPIRLGENLMLNVNTSATVGIIKEHGKDWVSVVLKLPVCAELKSRVTISRLIGSRWRLIGYGIITE